MNRTDVHGTLREMWETRPARPRDGRQVAGVAAAIARRYDIDPVLVRIGFVVTAVYGIGAALYIAAWVALPAEPDDGTKQRSGPAPLLVVGLVVATMTSIGAIFGNGGFLLPTLVALGLMFLLHRSRGHRGTAGTPPAAGGSTAPAQAPAPPPGTPDAATAPAAEDPTIRATPPSWDPLGAAPFAWDLPEPSPAPHPPARRERRPRTTLVTLAAALLAGGVTGLVMLLAGGGVADLPVLFGVVLAVLGTGLVVGAFTGSGRGLIPFALVLSALTYAVVAAPLDRWEGNVGSSRFAPVTAADVAPVYEVGAGSLEVDLSRVDLSVPEEGTAAPVRTMLRVGVGDTLVVVPPDADVSLRGDVGFGRVAFGDRESTGPDSRLTVVDDLGDDGVRSGRPIQLDIEAGAGNVEVRRG